MNMFNEPQHNEPSEGAEAALPAVAPVKMPSRRRLIKLGTAAVPVVATLASRPALAWHCQSPSAWGSEMLNPNTSLKTNQGHQSYPDETWYISNWNGNTARKYTKPWDKFFELHGDVTNPVKRWDLVKFSHLSTLGYVVPSGFTSTDYVQGKLGQNYKSAVLVAQLNFQCTPSTWQSEMSSCLTLDDLKNMATQAAPYNTIHWQKENIRVYLYNNWMAR